MEGVEGDVISTLHVRRLELREVNDLLMFSYEFCVVSGFASASDSRIHALSLLLQDSIPMCLKFYRISLYHRF